MQIIPMRDLKNMVEVERTLRRICEAQTLLDGLADIKAGRTVDGDTAIDSIRINLLIDCIERCN